MAWPADPAVRAPARPVPAPTPAGPACLSGFDREEPLSPAATLAVLLSASMLLFACALAVWNELTGDDRGAVPVELTQFRSVTDVARPAAPVRVRIPAIGVDAALERLGKHRDGTVQVPRHPARAGWFTGGPRPGEPGAAVLLGHYDSYCCPAVFYRLRLLRPGDRVRVVRADGTSVVFRVTRVGQYRTSRFPVRQVYFPTLRPQLRLITCAGPWLAGRDRYRDNTVIFAEQVG